MTFGPDDFQNSTNVSHETLDRLAVYAEILRKWQRKINLIGPKTVDDIWFRHIFDSAQIYPHLPKAAKNLIDLGSGAGFPALVLAIMGAPDVHMIESDSRKCVFLREAARVTATKVTIHNQSIENISPFAADIVTARALAPLAQLLEYARPFVRPQTLCAFLKGKQYKEELTNANYVWHINNREIESQTNQIGRLILIKGYRDVSESFRKTAQEK